jgi:hypothetical protein
MVPADILNDILHILRDPALQGGGIIIGSALSLIGLRRGRQGQNTPVRSLSPVFKKNLEGRHPEKNTSSEIEMCITLKHLDTG